MPSSLHRLLLFAATASAAQQRQCGCAVIGANASLAANPACPERFRGHDALDAGTAELTVAYLYYRDVAYAARHVAAWNAYDDALLAKLLFLIVDDGSPRDAAADVFAPLAPRGRVVVVRIAEDLAWNVGGARNLAFHVAPTSHVLAVDSDQKLSPALLVWALAHRPDGCAVLRGFPRVLESSGRKHRRAHPGVVLESRRTYWTAGGCDEDLVGHYGFTDLAHYGRVEAAGCALEAAASAPPLVYMDEPREKAAFFSRSTRRNRGVLDAKLAGDAAWSADYLRFSWDFVRLS